MAYIKWIYFTLLMLLLGIFGFTFTVREGSSAIVSRFGKIRAVYGAAGIQAKLPWPFEKVSVLDTRSQYMDSGYTETLTSDKKNIIMQTYMVWHIDNPVLFYNSIGNKETAQNYLNDLLADAKNGVMGAYNMNALVSTNTDSIQLGEIESKIVLAVSEKASQNYGIAVETIKIKRLALPFSNIETVFAQMTADRQKFVTQLRSEGTRDASIIRSNAEAEAARIVADGQKQVAEINSETQRQIAEIYADAYTKNPELFTFLKKLETLESSVSDKTVLIMSESESPFSVLTGKEGTEVD